MIKKVGIVFVIIALLIGVDFLLIRYRNTRPLFALEKDGVYYGIGFKTWHCETRDGNHENYVGTYKSKYACPLLVDYAYTLEIEPTDSCSNKIISYGNHGNEQYFMDCLHHITVNIDSEKIELKDALEQEKVSIQGILNTLKKDQNGVYKSDATGFANPSLSVRVCENNSQTLYYFSSGDVSYDKNYCTNTVAQSTCSFTRTYQLLHVVESNDENYHYLTLKQFQAEPVVTVKVPKDINPNIEIEKFYEFAFATTYHGQLSEIGEVFEHASITSIQETDKVGLDQLQTSCN